MIRNLPTTAVGKALAKRFGWAAARTRPDRQRAVALLAPGVLLWGCMHSEGTGFAHGLFERYEVTSGSAERQSVLTGFFLDDDVAQLAVLHVDEEQRRAMRIRAFDGGTWAPKLDATLGPDVSFVDVADIAGKQRLITYEPGRLNWFDPASGSETELVAVTCSFERPRKNEIPHVDVTHDVNDDGRDDLVLPDVDGFWVFVQTDGGAFADPLKLGPPTDLSPILGADGYRYDPWSQSRIHTIDYDHDGRGDLVFWNADHFEVHTQDERGRFAARAQRFTSEVAFDSDRLSALCTGDMRGRVLHSLADLDGDGVADLLLYALEGARASRKRSRYEVHFGTPTPAGGTVFAPEVGAAFPSRGGVQLALDRHDFDGDGRVDLLFTTIAARFLTGSLWKSIKGAMGDDVWLGLEFYRMRDGRYRDTPDSTARVALDGPPSHREPGWVPLDLLLRGATHERRRTQGRWPRAFNTTVLVGDVTGDGRLDLLLADHPRIMNVLVGVPGPELFAPPRALELAVPNDEEYTWLVDLDRDGKQDLLMHHPFTLRDAHGRRERPPGTEAQSITILMAR